MQLRLKVSIRINQTRQKTELEKHFQRHLPSGLLLRLGSSFTSAAAGSRQSKSQRRRTACSRGRISRGQQRRSQQGANINFVKHFFTQRQQSQRRISGNGRRRCGGAGEDEAADTDHGHSRQQEEGFGESRPVFGQGKKSKLKNRYSRI